MREVRGRFNHVAVLVLLLASIVLGIASPTSSLLVLTQLALVALALLIALEVSGLDPHRRRVIRALTGAVYAGAIVGQVVGSQQLSDASASVLGVILAVVAPVLVFLGIRRNTLRIDVQTVAGVLSIYLLIGYLFSAVFGLIDVFTPNPIFGGVQAATTSDRLYFAFVTLATVGYGDLVPATRPMRAAAVALAIVGQIYLVSVVALVVSNIGRPRQHS